MIAFDPNSTCEQAKAHYYEYLSGDTKECVSTHMLGHIDRCSSCQAEVRRLKVILAEDEEQAAGTGSAKQATNAITTYLRFHFVYLRAFVDCKTLKLFLPSLAIPALEVSVPTPITVHLDNCQQCTSDLKAIRRLKLTSKQLGRLGQLFAEEPGIDTHLCAEAQNTIASVGAMAFKGVSAEILRHLCICQECRKLLYEDRESRSEQLPQNSDQSPMPCDAISPVDMFDYVIPYGIEPDHDPHLMFRKSLTSHLINCPRCLDKMQKLHDTVYSILERHESGIVTCYEICDSGRESTVSTSDGLYKDWPIEVQVFDNSAEIETVETPETTAAATIAVAPGPEPKRKLTFLRPFFRPAAVAAAAAILLALLLIKPAGAVIPRQITKAFEGIENAYFATFELEKTEPAQEMWVFQASNKIGLKNEKEHVFLDVKNNSIKSRDLNTDAITTVTMDNHVRAKLQKMKKARWDLLPSNDIFRLYPDAKWERGSDENLDTEIYELTWIDEKFASRKWRGHVDRKKNLPIKIEWLVKLAEEQDYKRESFTEVSHHTIDEMKAFIKEAGF